MFLTIKVDEIVALTSAVFMSNRVFMSGLRFALAYPASKYGFSGYIYNANTAY